jgi:hypothetical protein
MRWSDRNAADCCTTMSSASKSNRLSALMMALRCDTVNRMDEPSGRIVGADLPDAPASSEMTSRPER